MGSATIQTRRSVVQRTSSHRAVTFHLSFLIGDLLVKFANIVPVAAAMLLIGTGSVQAESTTLALWTMPTAFPTGPGLVPTGTSYRPPNGSFPAGTPDQGLLAGSTSAILSTFHALAAATYTSPAGNGSQYSFSGNNWSPNDFYQVVLPTTGGWTNLSVSWDQAGRRARGRPARTTRCIPAPSHCPPR
jgi:hypothetical protein